MEKEKKDANSSQDNSTGKIDFSKLDFVQLKPVAKEMKTLKTTMHSQHTQSTPNNNERQSIISHLLPQQFIDPIKDISCFGGMVMEDSISDVLNKINNLDDLLSETGGNFNIDWYDKVDISLVYMNNEFLNKGFYTADIFHEEDNCTILETVSCDDETIQISNFSINYIDKIRFYDEFWTQMDSSAKFSITKNVDLLQNVTWYDN